MPYYPLDPAHVDPARVKKEREAARKLKESQWWKALVGRGICHYCQKLFKPTELTMDHVLPIARGGESVKSNVVPACLKCNQDKKLETPVDLVFSQLEKERQSAWGAGQTQFFFSLTPDRVLEAVESAGMLCTGRCQALGSYENRVYDVELESETGKPERRVIKFYRPGRWSEAQILDEHAFLSDLKEAEIPVVAPILFGNGATLMQTKEGIFFALFPRVGGRAPDELSTDQLLRVGRLLARIHNVGAQRLPGHTAEHRLRITADTYGRSNLSYLKDRIPLELQSRYLSAASWICDRSERLLSDARALRIHGDCHLGNLLWNDQGPFFLDFDDMLVGPAVQDIWLLTPGRDPEGVQAREVLLEGYMEMRSFDRAELKLIEPLRALRFIHYSAWLARRWEDPAFPQAFPDFGTNGYWARETQDLEEERSLIEAEQA